MSRVDRSLQSGDAVRRVASESDGALLKVSLDGGAPVAVSVETTADGRTVLRLPDGGVVRGAAARDGKFLWVTAGGRTWRFEAAETGGRTRAAAGGLGDVRAPMTGKIVEVHVKQGDLVAAGASLVTLEAMKMEHRLTAPAAARVAKVSTTTGAQAQLDDVLVVLEAPGEPTS